MNKNQTAREIIEELNDIAIYYDVRKYGLPIGEEEQYAKMKAFVLSKLDHDHLPDEGETGTLQEVLTNLTKNDSEKEKKELSRYDKIPFVKAEPTEPKVQELIAENERLKQSNPTLDSAPPERTG